MKHNQLDSRNVLGLQTKLHKEAITDVWTIYNTAGAYRCWWKQTVDSSKLSYGEGLGIWWWWREQSVSAVEPVGRVWALTLANTRIDTSHIIKARFPLREFTDRVHGPSWRPVNSDAFVDTRQLGPSTRVSKNAPEFTGR